MSVFDRVKDAKPSAGGTYFEAGFDFLVMVSAVKHIDVRNGKEGAFIVETKVLETNCPTCRQGADRSWYVDCDQDAAPNNLKAFGMAAGEALTGEAMDEDDIDGAGLLALTKSDQPLIGTYMKTSTYNKNTGKGTPFTRHKWYGGLTAQELKTCEEVAVKLGLKAHAKKTATK